MLRMQYLARVRPADYCRYPVSGSLQTRHLSTRTRDYVLRALRERTQASSSCAWLRWGLQIHLRVIERHHRIHKRRAGESIVKVHLGPKSYGSFVSRPQCSRRRRRRLHVMPWAIYFIKILLSIDYYMKLKRWCHASAGAVVAPFDAIGSPTEQVIPHVVWQNVVPGRFD
jgi:hypothetical protein|eukprot:COSAG03_NODE_2256_length_2951_cov_1.417251_4_plen_170_part_00